MQADQDTRTEAAALAVDRSVGANLNGWPHDPARYFDLAAHNVLAAADADDKANGIVRIKLDDKLENRIRHAIQHGVFGVRMRRTDAESATSAVVTVLREAVQP